MLSGRGHCSMAVMNNALPGCGEPMPPPVQPPPPRLRAQQGDIAHSPCCVGSQLLPSTHVEGVCGQYTHCCTQRRCPTGRCVRSKPAAQETPRGWGPVAYNPARTCPERGACRPLSILGHATARRQAAGQLPKQREGERACVRACVRVGGGEQRAHERRGAGFSNRQCGQRGAQWWPSMPR